MKRKTTDQFIEESIKIHGDKYDYSLVNYINKRTKVKIICSLHNKTFEQYPNNHLNGMGCFLCSKDNKRKTLDKFIKDAIKIHDNKYDYSLVNYVNNKTKIKIVCHKHNIIFEQRPDNHLINEQGCPECKKETIGKIWLSNNEDFIEKSNIIHNNKYDYSLVNYVGGHKKVKIMCKKHDIFEQNPSSHLNGNGCPMCCESHGEKEIFKVLKKYNVSFEHQKRFKNCKNKYTLPFDFYLPIYNICIEFDGRQHSTLIEYWGGENGYQYRLQNDKIKNEYCKNNNIHLIRIKYNENIEEKLKEYLQF